MNFINTESTLLEISYLFLWIDIFFTENILCENYSFVHNNLLGSIFSHQVEHQPELHSLLVCDSHCIVHLERDFTALIARIKINGKWECIS